MKPSDHPHVRHFLTVLAATVVAAVPALSDPAFRSLIENHPGWATYYPIALAVISTFSRAWTNRNGRNGNGAEG